MNPLYNFIWLARRHLCHMDNNVPTTIPLRPICWQEDQIKSAQWRKTSHGFPVSPRLMKWKLKTTAKCYLVTNIRDPYYLTIFYAIYSMGLIGFPVYMVIVQSINLKHIQYVMRHFDWLFWCYNDCLKHFEFFIAAIVWWLMTWR